MDRSAHSSATDRTKAGPDAANAAIGAPEGARVPQGTSHKDFALFGAPSPLILPDAERVAARRPHALFKRGKKLRHTGESRYSEPLAPCRLALDFGFRRDDKSGGGGPGRPADA